MTDADQAIVYYNKHTLEHKKLPPITPEQVKQAFGGTNVEVYTDSKILQDDLIIKKFTDTNLLMMSSGNFDGIDFTVFADNIIK
jgi:UDP-N-acetylmuramate: L-alanyl-gamma-D-glutamyl-meso-diaminopimelate ligase